MERGEDPCGRPGCGHPRKAHDVEAGGECLHHVLMDGYDVRCMCEEFVEPTVTGFRMADGAGIGPKDGRILRAVDRTDEPIFILRAQDLLSVLAISEYLLLVERYLPHTELAMEVTHRLEEFREWQRAHPGSVKLPD